MVDFLLSIAAIPDEEAAEEDEEKEDYEQDNPERDSCSGNSERCAGTLERRLDRAESERISRGVGVEEKRDNCSGRGVEGEGVFGGESD